MSIVILGGCSADLTSSAKGGQGGETELTPYDLSLDGSTTLTGQVAEGETTVEIANLSATEYVRQVVIDLGAHFLPANICSGKTIFGRVGGALCPEEITAASAFRSTGSLSMKDELASGECSNGGTPLAAYTTRVSCEKADAANVWTPTVMTGEKIANTEVDTTASATSRDTATSRYNGTAWAQSNIPGADGEDGWASGECGDTGNIESRITSCNRQWRASVGSKDGGGTWSLVSRQLLSAVYYEVWRDDKTGLIWSDNLGTASQCAAAGDNDAAGWCEANAAITESVCAETGFAGADITNIRGRSGAGNDVYYERKGGMGMNSENPVLWRLPTLKDYTTAYGNGMAFVLPRLGTFWTASVYPGNTVNATFFYVHSYGNVESYFDNRAYTSSAVRCVGR